MNSQDPDPGPPDAGQRTLNAFGVKTDQQAENVPLRQRITIKLRSKSHIVTFFGGILFSVSCALIIGLPTTVVSISGISMRQLAQGVYDKLGSNSDPQRSQLAC